MVVIFNWIFCPNTATQFFGDYRTYSYDGLNRMTSETNGISDYTSTYTYDDLGNITEKIDTMADVNQFSLTYAYGTDSDCGWNNLLKTLTFKNGDGVVTKTETVDYDAIGNPISYRGAALSWYGRQLKSFTKNGITSTMTYDSDGLRTSKTVNGSKTEYQYVGDKLFYEKRGDGNSFYYFYDSYGKLSAIYHHVNGTKVAYHVVTNAQGDVMALYDWYGTKVAEYYYDAWGNCAILSDSTSTGIATLNPFRYRSYYYDTNLGLYYLQSRYYDSEIGRFINSDNVTDSGAGVLGYNTFIYCANNPVNAADPSGHFVVSAFLAKVGIGALVGGIIGGVSNLATQLIKNDWDFSKVNSMEVAVAAGVGAVTGALSGGLGFLASKITKTAVNVAVQIVSGGVTNVVGDTLDKAIHGEEITSVGVVASFVQGCASAGTCLSIQAVVKGVNTCQFNQMKKSDQRLSLRSVNDGKNVTNKMMSSGSYVNDYLSRYNESVGAVNDFGWSMYVELFVK